MAKNTDKNKKKAAAATAMLTELSEFELAEWPKVLKDAIDIDKWESELLE